MTRSRRVAARVAAALFAAALLLFSAAPASADPGDGGVPAASERKAGNPAAPATPSRNSKDPGDGGVP